MPQSAAAKKRHQIADRNYQRERMKDIDHRLIKSLRSAIWKHLRIQGSTIKINVIEALGCSVDDFKDYLEALFYSANGCEMTWQNYGKHGWHLDHIQPMSSFDLNDEDELRTACHFTNIQPLFAYDNKEKGDSLDWVHPQDREAPF
jgi:hypothetical protein